MEFRLLGPVEVHHEGQRLPAGSSRERYVLAMLLLSADRMVADARLVDGLWPVPPTSARAQLHNLVSKLRSRFRHYDEELIVTRPGGYELRSGSHRVDLVVFRDLVARATRVVGAGEPETACDLLTRALSLWHGDALADVPAGAADGVRKDLNDERLAAAEAKLDVELALGRFDAVVPGAEQLLDEYPYREHLYARLMRALAASGRREEALAAYQNAYDHFVDELGVEPGPALRDLQVRILAGERVWQESTGTRDSTPRQLPSSTMRISGRDRLLADIGDRLRDSTDHVPVVVLLGPGGIGKSALALAVGHKLRSEFPDGQLYAELRGSQARPTDPHETLGRFLRALGMNSAAVPEDPDERTAAYRSALAGRRLLIVLDDAATEAQLRALLPGSGGCAVIATSRRDCAGLIGASRIPVPELAAEDAVKLLARQEVAPRVAADRTAAERIVALCGSLPLAICIAAARLASRPQWKLAEFADRLASEHGRLNELTVGDLDVRSSIALSYRSLSPDTARLFRLLGLLCDADWPGWLPQIAIGADIGTDAAGLLTELTDVHLVERLGTDELGQHRYRLHDLVAEFAAERARTEDSEAELAAGVDRALKGWLALAGEADGHLEHGMTSALGLPAHTIPAGAIKPTAQNANEWFELERTNLIAAIDLAVADSRAELAGALALRLGGFLQVRGYDDDRVRVLDYAVGSLRKATEPADLLMRILSALFAACWDHGQYNRLPDIAAEQLALARRVGDREREIRALAQAGHAARVLGRLADAAGLLDEAIELCDGAASGPLLSTVFSYRASTYLDLGHPARALPLSERALQIERSADRPLILSWRLMAYADVLFDLRRSDDAVRALTEAMAQAARVGDDLTVASAEVKLGAVEIVLGRRADARERLIRCLELTLDRGDHEAAAFALRALGDLDLANGEPRPAIRSFRESLAYWRRLGRPVEAARLLARLDRALKTVGDDTGAAASNAEWHRLLDELDLQESSLRLSPLVSDL